MNYLEFPYRFISSPLPVCNVAGNIPSQMQQRTWLNLDLAYNRHAHITSERVSRSSNADLFLLCSINAQTERDHFIFVARSRSKRVSVSGSESALRRSPFLLE